MFIDVHRVGHQGSGPSLKEFKVELGITAVTWIINSRRIVRYYICLVL